MSDGLKELKHLNSQLEKLLVDCHPGLMSWRLALATLLLKIALFSGFQSVIDAAKAELEKLGVKP